MARLPAAGENAAGNAVLVAGTTYYLALFSADPTTSGASNEFTGGGYARQPIVFATWAAGSSSNTASITVPNAGTTAATHFGIFSAVTAGTYLIGGALASSVTAASITFAIGSIAVSAS